MSKQRPILFSTPMVQAIIAGRKTMTRRTIKNIDPNKYNFLSIVPHTDLNGYAGNGNLGEFENKRTHGVVYVNCRFGNIGDLLYVKETYGVCGHTTKHYVYRATDDLAVEKWKPSLFMPKSAARIFLEITAIGVERVQDITDADAKREGLDSKEGFMAIWEKINGLPSWNANPFCWVLTFKQVKK